jgi:hypothetical protein
VYTSVVTTATRTGREEAAQIPELLACLGARQARVKFGAGKALIAISAATPELLYPHFDVFAAMLDHENQILKWNAMAILANLARVDCEGKLELILDAYLAPIQGPGMIGAANAMRGAARIAAVKTHLAEPVARRIMAVERSRFERPECLNVAIGHAMVALGVLAPLLPSKRAIRAFATRHMANPRPATAAKAARLLR